MDGGREVVAQQGATAVEGEAFEGVEDGAVGRGPPELAHLGDVSGGAFEFEAFRVGVVVETDRGHPCLRCREWGSKPYQKARGKIQRYTPQFRSNWQRDTEWDRLIRNGID